MGKRLTVKVDAVTPAAQVNMLSTTPQSPLLDLSVNPSPEAVAVYPAHVPVVYQVPAPIRQPLLAPPVYAWRKPLPEKGAPVPVGAGAPLVCVPLGVPEAYLTRYLTPVAGQVDLVPSAVLLVPTKGRI